ncbi:PEP/pyruvate-binding domain-containing protein [uncultured Clostridium sp.]|uniref:PEP/pyruvate-binding domain-containing protein n=1 Tax=uncultured Clostridium sp. TaxID=59620 RepID=UPI0025DBC75F|nr:PEP/pyruvate-binding domain-containing protein [uncultured Clostridium sp.]
MYVVNLNRVGKDDVMLAGGKAANLGEMIQAGFPVPSGFCITSESYDQFIRKNKFQSVIEKYLKKIYLDGSRSRELSQELMDLLSRGRFPEEMKEDIVKEYEKLGEKVPAAVRSSATAEDLPEASFAGQQETYLNVRGKENILDAVKKCFSSLWSERAIEYRKKTGYDRRKISLAVVVQEMIEGDVSGVLFTVNPTNENTHEMMINSSYGLGEAVVSGKVTPDIFTWDRKEGKITDEILGSKKMSILYRKNGGTIQVENEEKNRNKFSLSPREIEELVKTAANIEGHYGHPQDIEWAVKNNKIYILQSREITTLGRNTEEQMKTVKLSKTQSEIMNNLIEHCPTPIYPLEFEPFNHITKVKLELLSQFGILMKSQLGMRDEGTVFIEKSSIHISPKILKLPFKIKHFLDYSNNLKHTKDIFSSVNYRLSKIEKDKIQNNLQEPSLGELLDCLGEIMKISDEIVYVRFRYNIFPGFLISKFIHSKLQKIKKGMTEYDLLSNLSYRTWNMNKAVEKLAQIVNENDNLKNEIVQLKFKDKSELEMKLENIACSYRKFGDFYRNILQEFGWKSINSYQAFSTVSWNEDKGSLITLLKVAMKSKAGEYDTNKYDDIYSRICDIFSKRTADKLLAKVAQIRSYHVNREESLYMLEECYGLSRKILGEIAVKCPEVFKYRKDILYLTLDEVYRLDEEQDRKFFVNKIKMRKKSRGKNKILWESLQLGSQNNGENVLKGVCGNRGKASGQVCIVKDMGEFSKLKSGDILVCRYTDPYWTPLFSVAKAVISDTGGPLSHSAIVAREYNIPAVLGCGNATSVLKDGDKVVVDGDKGTVEF